MFIQKNISLKDKTTYQIGGNASFYCEPQSEDDLIKAIEWSIDQNVCLLLLGNGSNLLVSDSGYPGIVINVSGSLNQISWQENHAIAQCGLMLNVLVNQSIERSFSGMEELAGIPGTVGGAVVMNAGAYSMCIENTIEWVKYYDLTERKILIRRKSELELSYRSSYFQKHPSVVIEASFVFDKCKPVSELSEIRKNVQSLRREKQPLEFPNCGSVFKRPPNNFAGTLIEKCGLKGKGIGGAEVSVKHANFIVNKGNASAEDVRCLIKEIQKTVYDKTGILLETEVIFAGEFSDKLFKPDDG